MTLSRRTFLAATLALPATPPIAEPLPLRVLARRKGLAYGCCVTCGALDQPDLAQAILREAGLLVPEWEAKRGRVEKRRGHLDFSAADRLAGFAAAHAMAFRGHALVWHLSNPAWLEEVLAAPAPDRALLTDYVTAAVGHFRGRVSSWDVVNEAVEPKDGRPDGLRDSPWLRAFGPGYLDAAFHAARAADPAAELVYNDYGLDTPDAWQQDRQRVVLRLLAGFRARGVPCDALGIQGHLKAFSGTFDAGHFRRFLGEVAALGYGVVITEMDVADEGGPADAVARGRAQAALARRYLDAALAEPATRAVVTWGLSDRTTWLKGQHPLPFDESLHRKPLWHAIAAAFAAAPPRPRK